MGPSDHLIIQPIQEQQNTSNHGECYAQVRVLPFGGSQLRSGLRCGARRMCWWRLRYGQSYEPRPFSSSPLTTIHSILLLFHRRFSDNQSKPTVTAFYHEGTSTLAYFVVDPDTSKAMIIDPVMDFNFASGRTGSDHNDKVATFCEENKLDVEYICESHVHADHMTGGAGLRERFPVPRPASANMSQLCRGHSNRCLISRRNSMRMDLSLISSSGMARPFSWATSRAVSCTLLVSQMASARHLYAESTSQYHLQCQPN